jgi:hypothetical protein
MSKIKDIEKLKTQQHKLASINRSRYGRRAGLEGPFMTKSGKVVYYDKSKGRYLDPDSDMFLSYDAWKALGEEAPANATGTAVAGTGDDSSTVVVKKKKPMQDKLMRRFGIQETINRVIPDLEYEEDEITKRTNQLKEMASKKYVGYEDAINASIKTTEKRENWLKDLAINADKKLPYDKDTDQPKKYVAGLSDKEKKSHDRHLEKQGKKSDSDKSAYKQSPADKVAKTKTSVHTTKYKQMFGEEIKGLKNKAEKSGMPYSILKQVYDRGMAAWKGGHRPGTTPQQWAFARVNSFVTKSSGTWGKADADLAKKVRGS